jgi:hypothetical protein
MPSRGPPPAACQQRCGPGQIWWPQCAPCVEQTGTACLEEDRQITDCDGAAVLPEPIDGLVGAMLGLFSAPTLTGRMRVSLMAGSIVRETRWRRSTATSPGTSSM